MRAGAAATRGAPYELVLSPSEACLQRHQASSACPGGLGDRSQQQRASLPPLRGLHTRA